MAPSAAAMKRYNLVMPEAVFNELEKAAERRHTTVVDVLRRFIKLGLLADKLEETPDSALIFREKGVDREIVLI